jgi:transcriptional regulator with XRE-family HTH domain
MGRATPKHPPPGPGDRLRAERLRRRIRQVELAAMLECSKTSVSLIECNRIRPWPRLMRRAAEVFAMPVAELFPPVPLPQGELPEGADGPR